MRQYTFSNGVTVYPGEIVATAIAGVHMDPNIYPNPLQFDGFRFSRMKEQNGESAKLYAVNTSTEFLQFGHGPHSWYPIYIIH
jgi:cytochrome P450